MKLLLVCAAILSVCGAAPASDSTATDSESLLSNIDYPMFFVRTTEAFRGTDQYFHIFMVKNRKMTTLLNSGTSVASDYPPTTFAYFGAKDGIYRYDDTTEKVEKYGSITDSIINIIKESSTDNLYILTEDHAVYKVTEGGTKKVEIEEAKGAQEIMLDWNENLFFFGADKQPYVITSNGVKKIQGLPADIPTTGHLLKTFEKKDGVAYVLTNGSYLLHTDGTSELQVATPEAKARALKALQETKAVFDLVHRLENENSE